MKTLKNPLIPAIVLFLVLLGTIKHNALVYLRISPENFPEPWNFIYAAFIVLSIDAAVMVFVIHGKKVAAGVFSFAIMLVNLLYFLPAEELVAKFPHDPVFSVKIAASLIFSGMYAYAIYQFSELFVKDIEEDEQERKQRKTGEKQENSQAISKKTPVPKQEKQAFSQVLPRETPGKTPVPGQEKQEFSHFPSQETPVPNGEKREFSLFSPEKTPGQNGRNAEENGKAAGSEAGVLGEIPQELTGIVRKFGKYPASELRKKLKRRQEGMEREALPDAKKEQYEAEIAGISFILAKYA